MTNERRVGRRSSMAPKLMPNSRTKDADLAAIKARFESNYALIASDSKIASNPIVIAALANAKASEAALYAALADVDAKRNFFRVGLTHRRFRQAGVAAEKAHDALRAAIEIAKAGDR